MSQVREMNLYEKVIIPVAVAGIIGAFGLGWNAVLTGHETAVVVKQMQENQKALNSQIQTLRDHKENHETRISVVESKLE